VSPVKYELGFYIPEDDILHSHRREDIKTYILYEDSSVVMSQYDSSFGLCGLSAKLHPTFSYFFCIDITRNRDPFLSQALMHLGDNFRTV
jgi:hypothetical protein